MTPPRRPKYVVELVSPALCALYVPPHRSVFSKGHLKHFVSFNVFGKPVFDGLLGNLLRECTKQAIPNDERGTVVSVQIAHIRSVVDPMMRRGIEDKFNPSREFVKSFGVQPVLINETDAKHGDDHGWVVAK